MVVRMGKSDAHNKEGADVQFNYGQSLKPRGHVRELTRCIDDKKFKKITEVFRGCGLPESRLKGIKMREQ